MARGLHAFARQITRRGLNIMHCPQCGLENPDDSNFCRNCGTALREGVARAQSAALEGAVPAPAPAKEITLWEGHPALRSILPRFLLYVAIYAAVAGLVKFFYDRYALQAPEFWRIAAPVILILFALVFLFLLLRDLARLRSVRYRVTTERFFVEHGLFSKRIDEIELEHYKDISVRRGFFDRLTGCGDIEMVTNDPSHLRVEIVDVVDPVEKKEIIRSAVEARKKSLGTVRREEL